MTKTHIANVKQLKKLLETDLNCVIDLGDKDNKISQYLLNVVAEARKSGHKICEEDYVQIKAFVSDELKSLKQEFKDDNANGFTY